MQGKMNTNSIILVIGATREEALHIEKCLKDWEYEIVPLNDEGTGIEIPIPETSNLMLVYAQKEPENTIAICEQLRKDPKRATVKILLVIGRYKMDQFYELSRRMGNIVTIITPFSKEDICARIEEILRTT